MGREWWAITILVTTVCSSAEEIELPDCPTTVQFFPQSLPMHCKISDNAIIIPKTKRDINSSAIPWLNPPNGATLPPGFPTGLPPGAFPAPVGLPAAMPFMPPFPAQKLPVIVMPFYSQTTNTKKKDDDQKGRDRNREKRKKKRESSEDDTDDDCRGRACGDKSSDDSDTDDSTDGSSETSSSSGSGSNGGWWRPGRYHRKMRGLKGHISRRTSRKFRRLKKPSHGNYLGHLTPIMQYVTNDGYVIFEKKISDNEASDWLDMAPESKENENAPEAVDNVLRNEMNNLVKSANLDKDEEEVTEAEHEEPSSTTRPTTIATHKPYVKSNRMQRLMSKKFPRVVKTQDN